MNGRERSRLRRRGKTDIWTPAATAIGRSSTRMGCGAGRLKIPMVWLERRTRFSRYARVQLEMFTSPNRLATAGQAGMNAICVPGNAATWTRVSPHAACWDHVAMPNAAELAHAVFGQRSGRRITSGTKTGRSPFRHVRRGTCCAWLRHRTLRFRNWRALHRMLS